MDIEKVTKWLELTNKYQKNDFWRSLFENSIPEQLLKSERILPLYDLYQNDTHISVLVEVPGLTEKDLSIALRQKNILIIKGSAKPFFPAEMEVKQERYYGEFERMIPLPEPTDTRFLQLNFYNGLLQITYPRPSVLPPGN
ncbi:Hsp20/alpha crystallin family protein [Bacillus sp. REN3]|uniref:Hsp20/alpha crystallin family protein n=1 Tax=Bacillus sp. REN3 TaxID=2802440 RepID=UPI001AED6581|nr:Hsp20/alpha crystallin family protein [Bacillus sp. REN3]